MSPNPVQHLENYVSEARLARGDLLRSLDELPEGIRRRALEIISDRTSRAKDRPLLGEYAPWLIAEILGINNIDEVRRITGGWLHVYFFVLMVDDLIDRPRSDLSVQDFIIGSVIYQKGLRAISRDLELGGESSARIDSAFIDTAMAGLRDLRAADCRAKSFGVTPHFLEQKLAMLRICAAALKGLLGANDPTPALLIDKFLSRLSVGIQILDDITDVYEDAGTSAGNYALYLHSVETNAHPSRESELAMLLELCRSGALHGALEAAHDALHDASQELHCMDISAKTTAWRFVVSVRDGAHQALKSVAECGRDLQILEKQFHDRLCSAREYEHGKRDIAARIKGALTIVAQSS